ncbi:MAG: ATP-binding protein [Eubacteriales bacterium]|nr:ATP-binding protein [Eubacteriales bacterium]
MVKNLKIKTRIAISCCALIMVMSICFAFALNLFLKNSIVSDPPMSSFAPEASQIDIISYNIEANSPGNSNLDKESSTQTLSISQFNNILFEDLSNRIKLLSVITLITITILTFIASLLLAKKILKPFRAIAEKSGRVSQDIQLQKLDIPAAKDELQTIAGAYNRTIDRLHSAFNDLEQFNAYASHELRNALAVLRIHLETANNAQNSKEKISEAIMYVNELSNTLDDILALSSIQLPDCTEKVDLAMVAAAVVDEYRKAGYNVTLKMPEDGIDEISGKSSWLNRVVSNLVDNAVKHNDASLPVEVAIKQSNATAILTVEDKGKGIKHADLERIWRPYYRAEEKKAPGSGLGLALVFSVIEKIGGMVWVESSPMKGCKFTVSIPIAEKAVVDNYEKASMNRQMAKPESLDTDENEILRLEDVCCSLKNRSGNKCTLKEVSASFVKGRLYAIVGQADSGTTTLMSLMAGLNLPSKGRLIFKGIGLDRQVLDKFRREHIGIIFPKPNLLQNYSALENVMIPLEQCKYPLNSRRTRALNILLKMGINKEKAIGKLSGLTENEQKLTAIARAIVPGTGLILADEPIGNSDVETKNKIMNELLSLAHDENYCIIVFTQYKDIAMFADEVWGIKSGRMIPLVQNSRSLI